MRHDPGTPFQSVVKGAQWLLLKNRDSLRAVEEVPLEELLAAKHDVFVDYVLRDALKNSWGQISLVAA